MKTRQGFVSNSSSCAFIIERDVSVKNVERFLKQILDLHNEAKGGRRRNKAFDLKLHDVCSVCNLAKSDWKYFKDSYGLKLSKNSKVIISSVDDNSIPPVFDELIRTKYGCTRHHFG